MTDHDQLCRQQHWDGGDCFDCRLIAKVRADERAKSDTHLRLLYNIDSLDGERVALWRAYAEMLADLRAKIEALRDEFGPEMPSYWVLRQVLALIDGAVMETHDPLCPMQEPEPGDTVRQSSCLCYLIARVRADERAKARSLVAGLPVERRSPRGVALVERVRVLALLDGNSNPPPSSAKTGSSDDA